jgi:hypothetical protein
MAIAGTTTYVDPTVLNFGVKLASTNTDGSTKIVDAGAYIPGYRRLTTGTDVVRVPFNSANGKMVINAIFCAPATSANLYPYINLRLPPSTDKLAWRAPAAGIGTSTADSGWKLMVSTATQACASSETMAVVFGPFESAKYGHVMAASSAGIDAMQPYLEFQIALSTGSTGSDYTDSTTLHYVCAHINAFELP